MIVAKTKAKAKTAETNPPFMISTSTPRWRRRSGGVSPRARNLYASSNLPLLSLLTCTFHMGFVR